MPWYHLGGTGVSYSVIVWQQTTHIDLNPCSSGQVHNKPGRADGKCINAHLRIKWALSELQPTISKGVGVGIWLKAFLLGAPGKGSAGQTRDRVCKGASIQVKTLCSDAATYEVQAIG